MVQPNPPFIQTAGTPNHNDHRCDGIDGTATATHNIGVGMVDLHFKNFDNDIYRNNVGASKWRTNGGTAVGNVDAATQKNTTNNVIYNIQGMKVNAMSHGLYIVNGKKYVK